MGKGKISGGEGSSSYFQADIERAQGYGLKQMEGDIEWVRFAL